MSARRISSSCILEAPEHLEGIEMMSEVHGRGCGDEEVQQDRVASSNWQTDRQEKEVCERFGVGQVANAGQTGWE